MFKNISPDSVQSSRTCPANLGVRSCPVLSGPVQSGNKYAQFVQPYNIQLLKNSVSRSMNFGLTHGNLFYLVAEII